MKWHSAEARRVECYKATLGECVCVCVFMRERERERGREREKIRQTGRERVSERDKEREREREDKADRERVRACGGIPLGMWGNQLRGTPNPGGMRNIPNGKETHGRKNLPFTGLSQ